MDESSRAKAPKLPSMKGGLKGFFSDISNEMRKVVWPPRQDVVRLTTMVILVCIVFVLYLYAVELIVHSGIEALMGAKKVAV